MHRFTNKWPKCSTVKSPAHVDTVSAGEMALSSLYGAQTGEGLDALHYR